ncbi:Fungal specific transcription factor domain-containing protein [Pleurostoma richardsiae]|uniref:Fungal specific transcription factor domain-containing protein n=1 Tax=Pleurostoma richardsiae TaxID=41990 RepID=A0AA38VID7_9PEZI|nr:Fungal specific transcription factor domain-containing protein [Pleurostoma richardsiae]
MVYYGVLSKGCQRCRQRKVKCDQRKPSCLRCEKAKTQCPGYRDLTDVVFRDDTERIIRRSRRHGSGGEDSPEALHDTTGESSLVSSPSTVQTHSTPRPAFCCSPASIPAIVTQPIDDIATHFFFVNYTTTGPPYTQRYLAWLTQACWGNSSTNPTRAVIEAFGMAGICNIFHAPQLMPKTRELYGRALAATNRALRDPIGVKADTTLLSVLFLGGYEIMTFTNWSQYSSWAAHIEGATALLKLRGPEKLSQEPGIQLYIQLRSSILHSCLQRGISVPPALMETSPIFNAGPIEEYFDLDRPVSIAEPSFRLANLRAAIKKGEITDSVAICEAALQIDRDLDAWSSSVPDEWNYTVVDGEPPDLYFEGKRHLHKDLWGVHVWNNWRIMRILTNQLILYHGGSEVITKVTDDGSTSLLAQLDAPEGSIQAAALARIRELSTDICISSPSIMGSPRAASLIWSLFVVSRETLNSDSVRRWAVENLRQINAVLGVRQAGFLADNEKAQHFERDFTITSSLVSEASSSSRKPEHRAPQRLLPG